MKPATGKPKSLYREITIALVVLVSVVSVAVSLLNYFYSSRESATLLDNRVSGYTANLRESLEWPLWNLDDELIAKVADAFASNSEIASLAIFDDQQRVVYHRENPNGHQIRREFVIEHNGQRIGSVQIGLSLHAYEDKNRWLMYTGVSTALLLIVSLLGAMRWMLARLLKKPIDTLASVTREIVDGKYPQIDPGQTYAEFFPIVSGFKSMSDAVASREASQRQTNEQLAAEIDERKLIEEALRVNEERLKLATSAGGIGIWDWDIAANVLAWDVSMYALYGIGQEEFGGAYDAWLSTLHPDDRQFCNTEIQAALRGEREYAPEFRIIRPDGSIRNIKAYSKTYRDAAGNPIRMIGTNFDITDLKRVEAELRKYKDHLEEEVQLRTTDLVLARNAAETANRAKSVFLANMSHELRTPLNAILGFSNLMRKAASLSQEQRENLDIINRSGEYLLTLINDVLEMAKIESGRVQLENVPLDLGMLVRDVTDMMQVRAHEKGLQLLVDQSSEFPRYIMGDEARLRQILINLLGNAVKFTHQGGVTVRFGLKPQAMRLLIEIEDSGPGIRPEDSEKIFEPFVQVGEVAAQKGTGLGLTITRQFVQLMGGSVSLESTPGKGSLFRVELPVQMIPAAAVLKPDSIVKGEITGLLPGQPEYRILIVEDQLENQLLLRQLMERIGLQVKVAADGGQAIELFKNWHPDLIWMDRRMPVMDGIEATQRIRQLPGGAEVKIVAVTASAFMEQRDEMLEAGMDDFVRKPYRFNEIYEVLSKHLGLQYLYSNADAQEDEAVPLTAEMLAVLPAELQCELRAALESLEDERIGAVIHQVTAYNSDLGKTLSHLAGNFDYPAILNALQTTQSDHVA
ncbi:MAG: ATP-binding protein [Proteobacteria bacterium]|nr:ATP-binding protein [Pseudomonadota bacterium]